MKDIEKKMKELTGKWLINSWDSIDTHDEALEFAMAAARVVEAAVRESCARTAYLMVEDGATPGMIEKAILEGK